MTNPTGSTGRASVSAEPTDVRLSGDELRGLFLFEKLTDEQLSWLCERGRIELHEPGYVIREGEPATCLYVLLDGTIALSRTIGGDEVETTRRPRPTRRPSAPSARSACC